jgi:hypothetical protein
MSDRTPGAGVPTPVKSSNQGNNNNSNNNRGGRGFRRVQTPQPTFVGKTDGLKGFTFDYGDAKQSDMFIQTKKEIAEYVGRTMKYGNDIANAVTNLQVPTLTEPPEPQPIGNATTLSRAQDKIFEKQINEFVKRTLELEENVKTLYDIVWGQCTKSL